MMKNKKISLCLGGGGARGFIHIGVLRYLEENGYEIQEISGNSMGAVIAAAYALGLTSSEIHDFVKKEFSIFKLIDFSFGKGIISGNKIFEAFKRLYGHTKIESTKMPLSIVATCLDNSQKVVFTKGSILDAVRASMSVPYLFTPFEIDGKSHVDGMLRSNLPIELLKGDNVLALSTTLSNDFSFSSTKNLVTKIFNIGILENEKHSIETPGKKVTLLRPVYDEIDFIDFHKYNKIIEIGYEAAKKQLG